MTLDELKKYSGIVIEIESIEEEIAYLELPLFANGDKNGSKPSGVSDPTKSAAFRIIKMKEKLEAKKLQMEEERFHIEEWLDTVEDPEIRSIVRFHYLLGYTWAETSKKVYKRILPKEQAPRMRLKRYLMNLCDKCD